MSDVITIPVPKKALVFDIGGENYTLSLSDKSRAAINNRYQQIEAQEVANNQHTSKLQSMLTDELGNIPDSATDLQVKEARFKITNKYEKKFEAASDKAEKIAMANYLPFLDLLFGEGAGQKLYHLCGENIVAINKIIGLVMVELNKANNVSDYMDQYLKSVAALKQVAEQVGEDDGSHQ